MKNSAKKTAAQVTVSKEIQSMLKTAKKAESRVLLEQAKKFWQADVIKQRSSMPEEIQYVFIYSNTTLFGKINF